MINGVLNADVHLTRPPDNRQVDRHYRILREDSYLSNSRARRDDSCGHAARSVTTACDHDIYAEAQQGTIEDNRAYTLQLSGLDVLLCTR